MVAPSGHCKTPLQATLILLARLHLPGGWGTVEDVFRADRTGCVVRPAARAPSRGSAD